MTRDLRLALWIALAMLAIAELAGLAGLAPPPHERLAGLVSSPRMLIILGGMGEAFCVLYFFTRPGWREAVLVAASGALLLGVYLIAYRQEGGLSWSDLRALYAGMLSFVILGLLALRCARGTETARRLAGALIVACLAYFIYNAVAVSMLLLTEALHPRTYDAIAFNIDATLGFDPSIVVALAVNHWPAVAEVVKFVYLYEVVGIAVIYGMQLADPRRAPVSILLVFAASGAAALLLYHACPIAGPRYAFGDQYYAWWWGTLPNTLIPVEPAFRNGMPSMHFGWALLMWMHAGFLGPRTRAVFAAIAGITALATLSLGQHYLVDLVAAVPWVVALQALCALGVGWRGARVKALWMGMALTLAWIIAVRYGAGLFEAVPGLTWIAMLGTIVASVRVYRPLAAALTRAPSGVMQPVAKSSLDRARRYLDETWAGAVVGPLLVFALVVVAYWPARENGFVWDDWLPLVDSAIFRDPSRWWAAMLTPPLNDPVAIRPVAMLTFMLQLWAGQTTPAPFHVVNVVIHAANAALVAVLAWRALSEIASPRNAGFAAFMSGLVYGLHPALTEPVLWISCRYDLLMTLFLLVAMLSDRVLPERGYSRPVVVSVAFLAAAWSKETAVGFILALPLMHIAFEQLRGTDLRRASMVAAVSRHWKVYGALLCVCIVYLAARASLTGMSLGLGRMADQFHDAGGAGQRALAVAATLGRLVVDALWPFKAAVPSRSLVLPLGLTDALPLIPALSAGVIAGTLCVRAGMAGRVVLALVLAFVAALLPVSNLFPLPGLFGELWAASRYLTFPLVFLCLAAPFAFRIGERWLARFFTRPRLLLCVVAIGWVVVSTAFVRVTIPLWKDDGTINTWAIQNGARSYWRYQNLGDYYLKAGQPKLAREAFASAVHLRGDIALNWYYLGFAEAALGNTGPAREAFRSALKLNQDLIKARLNLAKLELAQGNPELAATLLEQGAARLAYANDLTQIGPFHYLLGIIYARLSRSEAAAAQLRQALEHTRDPTERRAAEAALRSIESARGDMLR